MVHPSLLHNPKTLPHFLLRVLSLNLFLSGPELAHPESLRDKIFISTGNVVFIYLFVYLFIFWLCWVFIAVHGFSLVAEIGATLCGAWLLIAVASLVAEHGL